MNIFTLTLPELSVGQASSRGYVSISTPINRNTEQDILTSMEKSMRGIDAVWMIHGVSTVELSRRKSELKSIIHA